MNPKIEKYGAFLKKQVPGHPGTVRRLLAATYGAIGLQAERFPSGKYTSSREYLQSYTARLLSGMLSDPSGAAVVNLFLPCEIFHALGVKIMAPEALACYIANTACEQPFIEAAEENGASDTFCSFHRVLLGLAETGVLKKPALVANTTCVCDANQLSFRQLADIWKVPQFVVDVPYETGSEAISYVAGQLLALSRMAEECVHKKLDENELKAAVARSIKSQDYFRRYLALRPEVHFPEAMTPELLSAVANHLYLGLPESERYFRMLLEDVKKAPAAGAEKKIIWMHILPNYQEELKEIFQGNERIEVLASDLTYDSLVHMDFEKPYESMARRIVAGSMNGPGSRRISRTLDIARRMKADGILIFCQWGCKQTQGIALAAKRTFEENGFPTLILDGDACDRSNSGGAQAVTRANAFVEELELRAARPL